MVPVGIFINGLKLMVIHISLILMDTVQLAIMLSRVTTIPILLRISLMIQVN